MLIFLHSSNLLIIKNNLSLFNRIQLETSTFPFAYWIPIKNKPKQAPSNQITCVRNQSSILIEIYLYLADGCLLVMKRLPFYLMTHKEKEDSLNK